MREVRGLRRGRYGWILAALATAAAGAQGPAFEWIQEGAVVRDAGVSAGLAWGDFDDDGDPDLFIANYWPTQPDLLYRNDAGTLVRVTGLPPVAEPLRSSGPAWGDFDNDGDLDLFVATQGNEHNRLFRNQGAEGFAVVSEGDPVTDFGDSYSAAWGDLDGDGWLDLAVANAGGQPNFLYRNLGDGTFRRVDEPPVGTDRGDSRGVSWADYDDDGDPDLYFANSSGQRDALYRNEEGHLVRVEEGPVAEDAFSSLGGAWGDYDGDGDLDLHVVHARAFFFGEPDRLYRNEGGGRFERVEVAAVEAEAPSSASSWVDVDYDGDLDLYVTRYAAHNALFLNDGEGGLEPCEEGFSTPHLFVPLFSTGHGWADFDLDGDLDLAVANWEDQDNSLMLHRGTTNHWLRVRLRSSPGNRFAVGARVRVGVERDGVRRWQRRDVTAGSSFRSQEPGDLTFGLGSAQQAAEVVVEWPSGRTERLTAVSGGRRITVREGEGIVDSWSPPETAPSVTPVLFETLVEHGPQVMRERYLGLREEAPDRYDYGTDALLDLARRLLREDRRAAARAVADLVVEAHPRSLHAWRIGIALLHYLGLDVAADRRTLELEERIDDLEDLGSEDREQIENDAGYLRKHRPPE